VPGRRKGNITHKVYTNDGSISVYKKDYPFAGHNAKHPSGISIELVKNDRCEYCGEDIINEGALTVFRYRGSQGATGITKIHKKCSREFLTINPKPGKGKCIICGESGANYFLEHNKKQGAFHKECVDEFLTRNDSAFDIKDPELEKIRIAIRNKQLDVLSKIKKATSIDYIFKNLSDTDAVTLLHKSRVIRKRFFSTFSALEESTSSYHKRYLEMADKYLTEVIKQPRWTSKFTKADCQARWDKSEQIRIFVDEGNRVLSKAW